MCRSNSVFFYSGLANENALDVRAGTYFPKNKTKESVRGVKRVTVERVSLGKPIKGGWTDENVSFFHSHFLIKNIRACIREFATPSLQSCISFSSYPMVLFFFFQFFTLYTFHCISLDLISFRSLSWTFEP